MKYSVLLNCLWEKQRWKSRAPLTRSTSPSQCSYKITDVNLSRSRLGGTVTSQLEK